MSKLHSTIDAGRQLLGTVGARFWRWIVRAKWGLVGVASRVTAAFMAVVGMVLIAVSFVAPQAAFANAANPAPGTVATVVPAANGGVTINLSGTWSWPGQSCAGRYGEGWAVDWWGLTTSSGAPSFSVNATQLTGVAQSDITVEPETATGSLAVPNTSNFFHFGPLYNGEDVNTPSTCTDTGTGGNATSSGAWTASATYPSAADVPPQLCVIMYDEHGKEGQPSATTTAGKDFNTSDSDNSIQTNAFNPFQGQGYCFSSNFSPDVSVKKTGLATATQGGTNTYTLTVSNTGIVAAKNVAVTDTLPTGETYVSSIDSNTTAGKCSEGGNAVSGTSPGVGDTITCMVDSLAAEVNSTPGTATISVTVSFAADASGAYTDCATVLDQTTPSCVTTTIVPQSLTGDIFLCKDGQPSGTEVAGALSATGPTPVSSTSTLPLSKSVDSGVYTLDASVSNAYQFVACGQTGTTIGTPAQTANQSVTVPAGGTGNGNFYVVPVTQTLTGHIFLCDAEGNPTTTGEPGTLTATGPSTIGPATSSLSGAADAGTYTLTGTVASDFKFVTCGQSNTLIGTPDTTATQSVTVPTGGTGNGNFYVVAVTQTPPTQTLTGDIFLCGANGQPTSTEVPGTLSASGPTTVASQGSPLSKSVDAGTYTLTGSVSSAYQIVACGQTGTTIGTPAQTATQSVTVPTGGTGTGAFYVVPVTQTIIGHIYLCDGTTETVTEVAGGSLATTNSPDDIAASPNPLSQQVPAGTYTVDATAPAGYHFTDCSSTSTGTPTTTTQTVIVPTGGTGTGTFYVAPNITLTVAKSNNAAGTGFGQNETATKAGEDVPFQVVITNPSTTTPVTITSITDAWPNNGPFSNVCSNAVIGTTLQPGASATCDFTVTNYAPAAGSSLTNTAEVTGCQSATSPDCTTVPATSTVVTPPVVSPGTVPPTVITVPVPVTTHSTLAFTGVPSHLQLLLEIGFAMLSLGMFVLWFTRPRSVQA